MSSVTGLSNGTSANPRDDDLLTDYSFNVCLPNCIFCAGLEQQAEAEALLLVLGCGFSFVLVIHSCAVMPHLCSCTSKSIAALLDALRGWS